MSRPLPKNATMTTSKIILYLFSGCKNYLFVFFLSDSQRKHFSLWNTFQMRKALKDQQDVNLHLRSYIDNVLMNIMEKHPELLEIRSKKWTRKTHALHVIELCAVCTKTFHLCDIQPRQVPHKRVGEPDYIQPSPVRPSWSLDRTIWKMINWSNDQVMIDCSTAFRPRWSSIDYFQISLPTVIVESWAVTMSWSIFGDNRCLCHDDDKHHHLCHDGDKHCLCYNGNNHCHCYDHNS